MSARHWAKMDTEAAMRAASDIGADHRVVSMLDDPQARERLLGFLDAEMEALRDWGEPGYPGWTDPDNKHGDRQWSPPWQMKFARDQIGRRTHAALLSAVGYLATAVARHADYWEWVQRDMEWSGRSESWSGGGRERVMGAESALARSQMIARAIAAMRGEVLPADRPNGA